MGKRILGVAFGLALAITSCVSAMAAPYTDIPDGNGKAFRDNINSRFSGGSPISPALASSAWVSVTGSPALYQIWTITDANSCTPGVAVTGGSGALCPTFWNGANWMPLGASGIILPGSVVRTNQANAYTGGPQSLGSQVLSIQLPNASSTGTTLHKLAKLTGAGTAVITATTDSSGAIGIVVAGAGTTGNADIAREGTATCAFDGATTQDDYVTNSSGTAGDCMDAGSARPASVQVIGRVLSTNGSAGTYAVLVGGSAGSAVVGASIENDTSESINSGSITALLFPACCTPNNPVEDTGAFYSASFITRLTAPTTGRYVATVTAHWAGSTGNQRRMYLCKNGSCSTGSQLCATSIEATAGSNDPTQSCTWNGPLTAGDYIEGYVLQDTGSARTIAGDWMSITRMAQ